MIDRACLTVKPSDRDRQKTRPPRTNSTEPAQPMKSAPPSSNLHRDHSPMHHHANGIANANGNSDGNDNDDYNNDNDYITTKTNNNKLNKYNHVKKEDN